MARSLYFQARSPPAPLTRPLPSSLGRSFLASRSSVVRRRGLWLARGPGANELWRYDQCFPFLKSVVKVLAIAARVAGLAVIRPSSRLRSSEVLEKFSDPMNALACAVP